MKLLSSILVLLCLSTNIAHANVEVVFYFNGNVVSYKVNGSLTAAATLSVREDIVFKTDESIAAGCALAVKSRARNVPFSKSSDCETLKTTGFTLAFSDFKDALTSAGKLEVKLTSAAGVATFDLLLKKEEDKEDKKKKPAQPKENDKDTDNAKEKPCRVHRPGIAFYDAIALVYPNRIQLTSESWDNIIRFYFPGADAAGHNEIKTHFTNALKENKLLSGIDFPEVDNSCDKQTGAQSTGPINLAMASLKSLGNADVTSIADGIAKFLVKRTKEELSLTFFNKFRDVISDPRYEDLQVLFPKTHSLLLVMSDEVYDYKRYIENLREAFKDDILGLNKNLPKVSKTKRGEEFFKEHPDLKAIFLSACYVSNELDLGSHAGDVLAGYPLDVLSDNDENQKHVKSVIQALQLVSNSLRDSSADHSNYWVSVPAIRDFVNDKKLLRVYLGLLLQQLKNDDVEVSFDKKTLTAILNDLDFDESYTEYKTFIVGFINRTNAIDQLLEASKPASDSARIERDARYFRLTVELMEYSMEVAALPGIKSEAVDKLRDNTRTYFQLAYATTDLVLDINRKNYPAAVNDAVHIYNIVMVHPPSLLSKTIASSSVAPGSKEDRKIDANLRKIRKRAGTTKSVVEEDKAKEMLITKNTPAYQPSPVSQEVLSKLVQYGSFMATIATAKNSDQVESAIEAFALPAGSARVKRHASWNVSLNAYTGLFVGSERIKGVESFAYPLKHFNSFGVTAPIGFAISKGQVGPRKTKKPFSTSLFLSVIDLGAVTAFRFKDTQTTLNSNTVNVDSAPSIQLKDIISPGLFLSLGIPEAPLSLNAGVQFGPTLRGIDVTAASGNSATPTLDVANGQYIRYSVSLCVDIPILNFFTRQPKTK